MTEETEDKDYKPIAEREQIESRAKKERERIEIPDYVTAYMELFKKVTDADPKYQESLALFQLSTAVGRQYIFQSLPERNFANPESDKIGARYLNLWLMFLGKSRIARKTSTIDQAQNFIAELGVPMIPQDFSPQGMISDVAGLYDRSMDTTRGCWINDECSGFFMLLKRAEWMASADTILSQLYDCRDYHRTLRKEKFDIIKPYITACLASTDWLPSLFNEGSLRQGFLNRFIYVNGKTDRHLDLRSTPTDYEIRTGEELAMRLKEINEGREAHILKFNNETRKAYNDYESRIEDKIRNSNLRIEESYYGNLPNLLIKISSLFRISRFNKLIRGTMIQIEPEDFERGIDYVNRSWNEFQEVINKMKTTAQSRPVLTEEYPQEYVYSIILAHGGQMAWTELMQASHKKRDELISITDDLSGQGRVKVGKIEGTTKPITIVKILK